MAWRMPQAIISTISKVTNFYASIWPNFTPSLTKNTRYQTSFFNLRTQDTFEHSQIDQEFSGRPFSNQVRQHILSSSAPFFIVQNAALVKSNLTSSTCSLTGSLGLDHRALL